MGHIKGLTISVIIWLILPMNLTILTSSEGFVSYSIITLKFNNSLRTNHDTVPVQGWKCKFKASFWRATYFIGMCLTQ